MKNLYFLTLLCLSISFFNMSCTEAYQEDFLDSHLDCDEWCSNTNFEFMNEGDCMSLCTTCNNPSDSEGSSAVCVCNWYEQQYDGNWDATPYKNKGQCVKGIKNGDSAGFGTGISDTCQDLVDEAGLTGFEALIVGWYCTILEQFGNQ